MGAGIGSENRYLFGMGMPDFRERKRSVEWDLNDWKWDGDLFIATPLNSASPAPNLCQRRQHFPSRFGLQESLTPTNCSSSSDEMNVGRNGMSPDKEKRRRITTITNDGNINDKTSTLELKLSGHDLPFREGEGGISGETYAKKPKVFGVSSNRAMCQVEGCSSDLSNSKDYHRRHKVCEFHSKASKALVGNVMQRFCQQCSRFHTLQEFDEGKRSCRRRLAGHNKRRRKTHNNNTAVTGVSLTNEQTSSYLLISLLRILSNIHNDNPEPTKDPDLLSHLLRSLLSHAGLCQDPSTSTPLPKSRDLKCSMDLYGNLAFASALIHNSFKDPSAIQNNTLGLESPVAHKEVIASVAGDVGTTTVMSSKSDFQLPKDTNNFYKEHMASTVDRMKANNFDLNDMYIDSDDSIEDLEPSPLPMNNGGSPSCSAWIHQDYNNSSPPQTSGRSDSASTQSPSSSSGDAQSRTDRIVFKLFGKEPNDIPIDLRAQILDWLSHSPSDIESYIRPGCVILTVYLHLPCTIWEELCFDLSSSLKRLLDVNDNIFWRTGWLYIRVLQQIAFADRGQVLIDAPLPQMRSNAQIISVNPIAISSSEKTQFTVKGFNLSGPATRILCLVEGKYLVQEESCELKVISSNENDFQNINFSCSIPVVMGRGFIEVEDDALSGTFFPFIVVDENICTEIRMLEGVIDHNNIPRDDGEEAKREAMSFINELGWLLHKSASRSRHPATDPNSDAFPFTRFKWLVEFSMERDWCSVLKKLLDLLFHGTVSSGDDATTALMALYDMNLLHKAARRNCRPLVEMLLKYETGCDGEMEADGSTLFLFRPDAVGPAGLTPLHIAAGKDGCEEVVDALTSDPKTVGMEAWKNARDSTGSTPEDYARLRGHYSYIHLVQRKTVKRGGGGQVAVEIPEECGKEEKKTMEVVGGGRSGCKVCRRKARCREVGPCLVYRPVMLSLVAIAAVCVCVALLFKSRLNVNATLFQWETLRYGTI